MPEINPFCDLSHQSQEMIGCETYLIKAYLGFGWDRVYPLAFKSFFESIGRYLNIVR